MKNPKLKYINAFVGSLILSCGLMHSHAQSYIPPAHGIAGYIVTELKTGKTIVSHNVDRALIPASTMKCVTTASALTALTPNYTFSTCVKYTGSIINDSITGSLIIEPGGDPTLDNTVCHTISSLGIRCINGDIMVDAPDPAPGKYDMIEDIGTDYCPGWSTFNYSFNNALVNEDMTVRTLKCLTDELIMDLWAEGINVHGNTADLTQPTDTNLLVMYKSPSLNKICRELMVKSNNLYAQSTGRALDAEMRLECALDSMKRILHNMGVDTTQARIVDFSGLSRANLITPLMLNTVLTAMSNNVDYVKCFPTVGKEGTVKRLLNGTRLAGSMVLKSGSMSGILAYAGYKLGPDKMPTHSIVIIVNNTLCKQAVVKRSLEKWFLNIF